MFFRTIILLSLLFLAKTAAMGQNIVPNYSFEVSDSCPVNVNCCPAFFGDGYFLGCKHWAQATKASPDYFHTCNVDTSLTYTGYPPVGVPNNGMGSQNAYEGLAYAGGIMYFTDEYKEYLMAEIPALTIDTTYTVSMYVSLSDLSRYAVDGFGALFTTYGSPDTVTWNTLPQTPQVDYSSYGIISDSTHWTKLTKTFVADSAYKYIIIGVFKNNTVIDTLNVYTPPPVGERRPWIHNYYFFDNISVSRLFPLAAPTTDQHVACAIQPNPAQSILTISSPTKIERVEIHNLLGQAVYSGAYDGTHVQIDVADLPRGTYILRINGVQSKRFVKQ